MKKIILLSLISISATATNLHCEGTLRVYKGSIHHIKVNGDYNDVEYDTHIAIKEDKLYMDGLIYHIGRFSNESTYQFESKDYHVWIDRYTGKLERYDKRKPKNDTFVAICSVKKKLI